MLFTLGITLLILVAFSSLLLFVAHHGLDQTVSSSSEGATTTTGGEGISGLLFGSGASSTASNEAIEREYASLMKLIADHNRTIQSLVTEHSRLRRAIGHSKAGTADVEVKELLAALSASEREVERLRAQLKDQASMGPLSSPETSLTVSSPTNLHRTFPVHMSTAEAECERRYGDALLDAWLQTEEVWCESPLADQEARSHTSTSNDIHSELRCYPYLQPHKKAERRPADVFCVAANFIIDFDKVRGNPQFDKTRKYLSYLSGATYASCKKTAKYGKAAKFMSHNAEQMREFVDNTDPRTGAPLDPKASSSDRSYTTAKPSSPTAYTTKASANAGSSVPYTVATAPVTYYLPRDEDCENAYHATADFMNMYIVYSMLGIDKNDVQVIIADSHPLGPYIDLMNAAFSGHGQIADFKQYKGKVLFPKLIFHLESPAALIFPSVSMPDREQRCAGPVPLYSAYSRHVLQSLNLLDVKPPPVPTVLLSLRKRTNEKNVGRIMANEDEVIALFRGPTSKLKGVRVEVADLATMPVIEQIKLLRSTSILVGVHGAGLMGVLYMPEEAILIEVHPSYRQDRHFRIASKLSGKAYIPMRATRRETCHGTSDNVFVDVAELEKVLDVAVRMARSFDDGNAECGSNCPVSVLAIEAAHNPEHSAIYYKEMGLPKERTPDLSFPC